MKAGATGVRRRLLARLKHAGQSSVAELAADAGVSYEAVRQQLIPGHIDMASRGAL